MTETSWRTLMLMTTLFLLVVIFEGTVRPRRPKTPLIGPAMGGAAPADCNKVPDKAPPSAEVCVRDPQPARSQPQPVMPAAAARKVWINNELVDLAKMGWASPDESDDPNGSAPAVVE